MAGNCPGGYTGRILRVNLRDERCTVESVDESTLRKYIGGIGLAAKFLYDEVPPEIEWDHPENLLIFALGPLNGTSVAGSGTYSLVTKGPLTGGATSTQASGDFGAYLKFAGFDFIIFEGTARRWLYLYLHKNHSELRDAGHLVGKDTYDTEDTIKKELAVKKKRDVSVVSIGPGGENLVKFSAVVGDKGHVASKNGVGAVMGAKKIKAIAAARGDKRVEVDDKDLVTELNKEMIQAWKDDPFQSQLFWEGNSFLMLIGLKTGQLPVKNLTTNVYSEEDVRKFTRPEYKKHLKMKPKPCWACPSHHLHMVEVTEGPYKGYVGEEPDYELWSQTSNLIGNKDIGASIMLTDVIDRLGLDGNEGFWIVSLMMECYEKGIITKEDTGGLELKWGDVEAVRELLTMIARREGIGDILAEGIKRATQHINGKALKMGVYIEKGHAPRGHDHRPRWIEELDYATSGAATIETGPIFLTDPFDPHEISTKLAKDKWRLFMDSLVLCMFPTMMMPVTTGSPERMVRILNAVTGWDFTMEEADLQAHRTANLLRCFNLRHGIKTDVEYPSPRYGSTPKDGPAKGMGIMPHWDGMLDNYYKVMGWDRVSGKPLPETLKSMELEYIIDDIW